MTEGFLPLRPKMFKIMPDFISRYSLLETDSEKITLTQKLLLIKTPQFSSDLTEILATLPTHELVILLSLMRIVLKLWIVYH